MSKGKGNTWIIVLGVVLLIVGLALFLQSGGMLPAGISSLVTGLVNLWPLILVVLGLSLLFRKGEKRSYMGGLVLTLLGLAMLGATMNWWGWPMVGPAVIVGVGLGLIINAMQK